MPLLCSTFKKDLKDFFKLMVIKYHIRWIPKISTYTKGYFLTLHFLTLFRMDLSGAAHGLGKAKKAPSLKSVTHILQRWNLAQLYLAQRRSKKYMNHVTDPLSSADISIFSPEITKFCYIKKYIYRLHFDT